MSEECKADCAAAQARREFTAHENELCGICMYELGEAPCVRVCKSNHVFHGECIKELLERGYTTLNITWNYLDCPSCKAPMDIPATMPVLGPLLKQLRQRKERVQQMAMREALVAGLRESPKLADPNDQYFEDFPALALASCTFYECHTCKEPYFGGMNDCRVIMREER